MKELRYHVLDILISLFFLLGGGAGVGVTIIPIEKNS